MEEITKQLVRILNKHGIGSGSWNEKIMLAMTEAYELGLVQENNIELNKSGSIIDSNDYIECGCCDGCGWYEGGKELKTTCEVCNGTGKIRDYK